jgi:hypothetical protein
MFINNIKPDGHRRRPPKRITRKPKGCALCDAGQVPDGQKGHKVPGEITRAPRGLGARAGEDRWIACGNQAQERKAPSAASDLHYDRAVKARKSKPKMPSQAAIGPAAFIPEQRIVRPA